MVLCERVVRICERALASEPPHILVTTFNKPMLKQLIMWTKQRISASTQNLTLIDIGGYYQLSVSNARQVDCKIRFLNRDKLPTRVWQTLPSNRPVLEVDGLEASAFDESANELFDVDFIYKELELVVLGMDAWEHERYVDPAITARHGRRQRLTRRQRAELWPKLVARANVTKFPQVCLYRRLAAQRYYESTLASGKQVRLRDSASPITHLLVDEGQDMTRSELRLLARTPIKAQRLFVTGDTTQAIHTAGISPRPRIEGAQWEILTLVGSYRLPALVCEALQPLAENILARQSEASGSIPEVRRSAVPGPRPIVVDASDTKEMVNAVATMSSFEARNASERSYWSLICEPPTRDHVLAVTLRQHGLEAQCESMLKIKGLERPLVILPTDATPAFDEAIAEWVYTALTRSVCVLVIAVRPDTTPEVANALSHLDTRRQNLMFWDQGALSAWDQMLGSISK